MTTISQQSEIRALVETDPFQWRYWLRLFARIYFASGALGGILFLGLAGTIAFSIIF